MATGEDINCIFCRIGAGGTDTELLYEDQDYICFKDIHPDAIYHYLVIPKAHLPSVKYLTAKHIPILDKMEEIGREVLRERFDGDQTDSRTGFHWPPFSSVAHLHLHVLAPVSQMGFTKKHILFRKDSMAFVTVEWALKYLRGKL